MDENIGNFYEIPEDSVVMNVNNISQDFIGKHSSVLINPDYWHAVIIHNVTNRNRNETLKIILNYVYPEALLPIHFKSRGSDCIFLARNCYGAILKLLNDKLVIPDPTDATQTFTCEIILKFSTISNLPPPASNISTVLDLLYDDTSKTLNLERFSDNERLTEYMPLSQPKLLCFALCISDEMKPACIKLNDNEIKTLSPFEVLRGISSLKRLDLRNNLIEDIEELEYLKIFDLVELWLDGNPICDKYDAFSYVQMVTKILPMLKGLDDVPLGLSRQPMPQQNFLCSEEGFGLVDQFVNHFFSLYDSKREILIDLYHPSAMFSMTTGSCQIIGGNDRLCIYRALSRNFLDSGLSPHMGAIGNTGILNTFSELPGTKHNMQTFSVDLFYYSERSAVLSIIGTFCEDLKQKFQPEVLFGFKRTFTLIKHACEYTIYNDLLHIYEASKIQTRTSYTNHPVKVKPRTFSAKEKNTAEAAMSCITGVNSLWIKRLLEDANYNVIEFLRTFMSLLERDHIPGEAYSRNNTCSAVEWLIPKMVEYGMGKFENSLQQEALDYIIRNPSFLTNINIPSMNMRSTVYSGEIHQQYWMQKNACQNLEMSKTNSNHRDSHMFLGIPNQYGHATHVSEYYFQSPEFLNYQIQHPKKNRLKRSISDAESIFGIENKKMSLDIMSDSLSYPYESIKNTNKELMNKHQANTNKRSNLILVQLNTNTQETKKTSDLLQEEDCQQRTISANVPKNSARNLLIGHIRSTSTSGYCKKSNQIALVETNFKKHAYTDCKSNTKELVTEEIDIQIRPKLALLGGKWTYIENCDEYNFQLAFNKWILMQKGKEEKWFSKQDDFQKNFTCWKKHFPTYSNEDLNHSLHSSCINSHLKSVFDRIQLPVTYWDFAATVPEDIRPPKRGFFPEEGIEKIITPDSDYGFVFVEKNWILVKNNLNKWTTVENKRNILWKGDKWITEQLAMKEIDTDVIINMDMSTLTETEESLNNELEKDTLILCDDEEQEIYAEDLDITKELEEEEMKTIYADDTEPEETITQSNFAFHLSENSKEKKLSIAPVKYRKSHAADELFKWKKIFEFVPYVPTIALMKGHWIIVCGKADLKFHKTLQNEWVLLEKNSETNTWQVVNDDFCVEQKEKIQISNRLGRNIFDHIPMPVTMYDFPSSLPSKFLPPGILVIDREMIKVTPDCGYAYVSVKGQWIAVKKTEQDKWVAVDKVYKTIVNKIMENMPAKLISKETTIKFESEDDKKISSATCNLLHILTGTNQVKPLTHSDIEGPEEKRPPRLALTEINGKQHWCYVTPCSGKGFVLEDGVWVKVVLASGKWKATLSSAYQGYVIGYYLFNNIWVTMKKYILGGKWSPTNTETIPTTYWNFIGPEELKPPRKIFVAGTEKFIHNNSNMGFIKNGDVWILMESIDGDWKIVKENQNCFYKLVNGIWRMVEKDSIGKCSYEPDNQKMSTYQNFSGIKKYAPPKQINFLKGKKKIMKIIDQESGMGFILKDGVWVLMQLKNGNLIQVKNSKGQTDVGFRRVDDKFRIIRTDENGHWINLEERTQQEVVIQNKLISLHQKFKDGVPVTHDRILIDFPNYMKPPKYALIKDFIVNKLYWRLVDENSGYGFTRENEMWLLMKWNFDKNWENSSYYMGVEYKYKIINNTWVPMKNVLDRWVPIFDPYTTPIIPDLCIDSPERDLPNKIEIQVKNCKSKINITPLCGMGYMKFSDKYVLMRIMLSGEWMFYEHSSNNTLILKMNDSGKWTCSTCNINSFDIQSNFSDSDIINENEKISTYHNMQGTNYTKPPQYIKIMEKGTMKWKEIHINHGFGFVKRKYWILVKKTDGKWTIVNKCEGYKINNNRWMLMKKHGDKWLPSSHSRLTPRCSLDSVDDSVFPIRVISYNEGQLKYINTANDCSLGYIIAKSKVYILMKEQDGTWITMKDDFLEAPTMAFKLIDCKWQRMKKDTMEQWIVCKKQLVLPVLHIDVIGNQNLQPPAEISIPDSGNKECRMAFNIFSNEGFIKKQGVWILMKPSEQGWSKYPGIFGHYGYKVVNDKLIVMEEKKGGKWVVYNHDKIPIMHPVTYNETEGWPEVERPPIIFYLHHTSLLIKADETTCQYGFVKNKDVWLVVRKCDGIWKFEITSNRHIAYKLIDNRWVTMRLNTMNDWIPTFKPSCTPFTHFIMYGKFEERPPLRIVLNDHSIWTTVLRPTKLGFSKDNDMWLVLEKNNNLWKIYENDNEQLAYKIVDGQWRRFTRAANREWNICTKAIPPVLSFDFIPEYKNAPPSSLCFGDLTKGKCLKQINIGLRSGKGFIVDNGAWVLMENYQQGNWKKFNRFPWIRNPFAYMLKNDVWRIAMKDFDGSWKCGLFNQNRFICDHLPHIQVKNPFRYKAVENLPVQEGPPKMFIIYIDDMPKVVSLTTVEHIFGFQYYKGAWVLLELGETKFWKIAGGVIAYKLIHSRWVIMTMQVDQWVPSYDPVTTPITHFESVDPFRDSRPPLRIVINENGTDRWKVIFQNSGYGFTKQDDKWVLMKKRCDGTWENHRDYLSELTSYKMVNKQWTRFKKRECDDWMRVDSSLPVLQCDFSILHDRKPPPSFKKRFLVEPRKTQENVDTFLDLYSKFGFRQDNGLWILMNCDSFGLWSEYKLHPKETNIFGYKFSDDSWKLLNKNENGQWVEGKLENLVGDGWQFLKKKIQPLTLKVEKNIVMEKNACKVKDEQIVEDKDEEDKYQNKLGRRYEIKSEEEDKNEPVDEIKQIDEAKDENIESFIDKNTHEAVDGIALEVNDEIKESIEDLHEQEVNDKNKETYGDETIREIETADDPVENMETVGENHRQAVNDKEYEDENELEIEDESGLEVDDVYRETVNGTHKQKVNDEIKDSYEDENKIEIEDNKLEVNDGNEEIMEDKHEQEVNDKDNEPDKNEIEIEFYNKLKVNDEKEEIVEDKHEQKLDDENKEPYGDENEIVIEIGDNNKLEANGENKEIVEDKHEQKVNDKNKKPYEYEIQRNIEENNQLEVNDEEEETVLGEDKQEFNNENKEENLPTKESVEDKNNQEIGDENEQKVNDQNENKLEGVSKQDVNDDNMEIVEDETKQEVIFENKRRVKVENGQEVKVIIENGQNFNYGNKGIGEEKTDPAFKYPIEYIQVVEKKQRFEDKDEQTCKGICHQQSGDFKGKEYKEKITLDKCLTTNNSWNVPLTNPVKYHQFVNFPIEERPPRNVCLKVRGDHRRISLVSKLSKIGFQHHNGVWVLLECLSGFWKILHNSAGFPLAYKLMDNRWVSMRIDKNGSWIPTFNPVTTPRTYFDSEGHEDTKPPRRVIFNENDVLKWKEISEFSGFGFVKNKEDMWVLMRNSPNNNWIEYRNNNQEICAFKIQDFKWTKFTKGAEGVWKNSVEHLPVLNYDFAVNSEAAPPEFTPYLQKISKIESTNVGFQWDSGAWILVQRNENHNWTPILDVKTAHGFVRAKGELWNVVKKDKYGRWILVEMNRSFQSVFEDFKIFPIGVKREIETVESSNKNVSTEKIDLSSSLATSNQNCLKQEKVHIKINEGSSSPKTVLMAKITTPAEDIVSNLSIQSITPVPIVVSVLAETKHAKDDLLAKAPVQLHQAIHSSLCNFTISSENISESPKQSDEQGCHRVKGVRDLIKQKQIKLRAAEIVSTGDNSSPIQELSNSTSRSVEHKTVYEGQAEEIEDLEQKRVKYPKVLENQEELNLVELYLAAKPDCCLGCPELQNLLREFRPSNVPNKIIRKTFRLPDGNMRILSIPKALPDSQKPSETRENMRKRRKVTTRILDHAGNSSNKKIKYNK